VRMGRKTQYGLDGKHLGEADPHEIVGLGDVFARAASEAEIIGSVGSGSGSGSGGGGGAAFAPECRNLTKTSGEPGQERWYCTCTWYVVRST
jgi:hypothetical protein